MDKIIGFICMLIFLGYVAQAAVRLMSSLFAWGVAAVVVLSLLVFLTHP
jgi:hypothetical protein